MNLPHIDRSWTLFLDRDGVLNRKVDHGYVLCPDMLDVLPDAPEAIVKLRRIFGRIIIVTNQRGIALGLMDSTDLERVNAQLLTELGGDSLVDAILHCPHDVTPRCGCRKPAPGLVAQAAARYPEIVFRKSVMVGDSDTDIELGRALGMLTVHISTASRAHPDPAITLSSLGAFASLLVDRTPASE